MIEWGATRRGQATLLQTELAGQAQSRTQRGSRAGAATIEDGPNLRSMMASRCSISASRCSMVRESDTLAPIAQAKQPV